MNRIIKKIWAALAESPYWRVVVSSISAWIVLTILDLCLSDTVLDARAIISGLGLATGAGILFGAVLAMCFGAIGLLPTAIRWGLWIVLGSAGGFYVADDLGALGRLGSIHQGLAMVVLSVCIVSGIAAGISVAAFQPGRISNSGLAMGWRPVFRITSAALLAAAGVGCVYADRTMFKGLYEIGHSALRFGALLTVTLSGYALIKPLSMARFRTAMLFIGAVLSASALPFILVNEEQSTVLQRIAGLSFAALSLDVMRSLTDVDGDGYSGLLAGGDCAALNSNIYPGAREIPGNGADDNCRAGDAHNRSRRADPEKVPVPGAPSPVNVVLITIDSVRADHLKTYGYALDPMPHLSRWAKDAVVFSRAFAVAPWTSIAVPSILRGIYPRRMQWARYAETNRNRLLRLPLNKASLLQKERQVKTFILPSTKGQRPLPFWLKRRGMATAAVVNDGLSRMLTDLPGISDGFESYNVVDAEMSEQTSGDSAAADLAIEKIGELTSKEPFFFWVHFFGAHVGEFNPPPEFQKLSPAQQNNYDDKLYYSDAQLNRVLSLLRDAKTRLPMVVVITSDHGEVIDGKRMWHGSGLTEDVLRVPLIVKAPGLLPKTVRTPVGTIDIARTILALTETPAPDLDGIDLLSIVRGKRVRRRIGLLSDNWRLTDNGGVYTDLTAVYDGERKLTISHRTGIELFTSQVQWDADLSGSLGSPEAARLRKQLDIYLDETGGPIKFEKQ